VISAVPHEEIPHYLNALDGLVLPSLTTPVWKEQFGHVLIEAMACEVPVIGSNSGAIPEVLGEAGLIFPEGDLTALSQAIMTLQSDAVRRAQLAQAGRVRVLAHYTHERIAAANAEFFQQVLRP
jgi:glycosyltransferase involved in cell wall biosynthesis